MPAFAKVFEVCTVEIEGGITAAKRGPQPLLELYENVIDKVSAKTGHEFNLVIAPAARCIDMFGKKSIDIMWPFIVADDQEAIQKWGYSELPVYSMPIITIGHLVLTKNDRLKINDISSLNGKTVVSARGYGVPESFEHSELINKTLVNTNEQVAKMVALGRVDAGIIQNGWVPGLRKQGLLEELHYGSAIDSWGGAFTFQNSKQGIALANTFSNVILALVIDGSYAHIMHGAPYYISAYQ